jgi:uroporphyrinogen-III decarboxylase
MAGEPMTPNERVWAAIRLEPFDRVPVVPTLLPEPAAGLLGRSQAEIARDNQAAVRAVFQVFDEYGGWDNPYPAAYTPIQLQASGIFPLRMRIPGRDLAEEIPFQLEEAEVLLPGDYDKIAELGFDRFFQEDFLWRVTALAPDELGDVMRDLMVGGGLFLAECAKRGLKPLYLANSLHPFFRLSLMRSMLPFTRDLYHDPKPVERALERMTADLIPRQIEIAKQTGIDLWMCSEERAGAFFFPPTIFEHFWWPYTRRIVDAMWSEGIVTLFHLDTCWDKNLHYFKQLPKGSAVLELDSTTDIFVAKEILRGHLCLKGDVSAVLLSIGTPEEVEAYCKKCIDVVGRGGGYILSSGCSVPPNVKPENFHVMIETAKSYRPSA